MFEHVASWLFQIMNNVLSLIKLLNTHWQAVKTFSVYVVVIRT